MDLGSSAGVYWFKIVAGILQSIRLDLPHALFFDQVTDQMNADDL